MGLYGGQINAIAVDPLAPEILYAGSWMGDGVFKSTDQGRTWMNIPQDHPSWFRNMEVFDIAIDPNNPSTIWVANNHYIDVSYDDGESWKTFYFASDETRFCYDLSPNWKQRRGNIQSVQHRRQIVDNDNGRILTLPAILVTNPCPHGNLTVDIGRASRRERVYM